MNKEPITGVAIRKLGEGDEIPYDLLLEADPSRLLVDQYLIRAEIYIAVVDEVVVGAYVVCPLRGKVVEIKNISVKEDFQGRGIGTLMLRHACIGAKEKGCKKIVVGTGNLSLGPLYLYQREGFDLTSIRKNFFVDYYPEAIYEYGVQVRHMLILTKDL